MKLLVVDYLAPIGHIGFNSYHIGMIKSFSDDVVFMSSQKHISDCNCHGLKTSSFPECFFISCKLIPRSIYNRIQDILKLLYLKCYLRRNRYDKIIFLSYDIIATGLIKFRNIDIYLVNHANIDGLKHKVKRYLTIKLPSNYKLVTLAPYIQDFTKSIIKNKEILMIPHGLSKVYKTTDYNELPFGIEKLIYCPANSSCNTQLLESICNNEMVHNYLKNNGITLIIKGVSFNIINSNIMFITGFIDDKTYSSIMSHSIAVFAPYDISFKYRISAILMECFANNIPVISFNSIAYLSFKQYINYEFEVDGAERFVHVLKQIKTIDNSKYYINLDMLSPYSYWKMCLQNKQNGNK